MSSAARPTRGRDSLQTLFLDAGGAGLWPTIRVLTRLAATEPLRLASALLAAGALSGLALLPALLIAHLIDTGLTGRDTALVIALAGGLLGAAVLDAVLAATRRLLATHAALAVHARLLPAAWSLTLRLQADAPLAKDAGTLGQTFEAIERLARGACEESLEIALSIGTVIVLLGAMLWLNPTLAAVVTAIAAVLAMLHGATGRSVQRREAGWFTARSRYWSHLIESLAYLSTVRRANAYRFAASRFDERLRQDLSAQRAVQHAGAALDAVSRLATGTLIAAVTLLGGQAVLSASLSLGEFVLFLSAGGALATPLTNLSRSFEALNALTVSCQRLAALVRAPAEPLDETETDTDTAQPIIPGAGGIATRQLTFRHSGADRPLLDGLCLTLAPGERVALRGASGQGKSTLASLLSRERAPQAGQILLDGHPSPAIALGAWRNRVVWVPHTIDVFSATLAENIAIGWPEAPRDRIAHAARIAGLDTVAARLPNGLDTDLGAGGAVLSAGQTQRLGIARAVLREPAVLILDESTSALDADTEADVLDRLCAALPTTALLAITHRASVVARMDRVIDLDAAQSSSGH